MKKNDCVGPDGQFECPNCGSFEPCADFIARHADPAVVSVTHFIVDENDFCRMCVGRGGEYDISSTGGRIWEPCMMCGGSGKKSVRIG